ncbi:MAG: aldehyde dehydrogenase family protein [Angustibacter sp.]
MSSAQQGRIRRLPIYLQGRRISRTGHGDHEFLSRTGVPFQLPRLGQSEVEQILGADRHVLARLSLQDILVFLNRVGKNWRSTEYPRRRLYVQQLREIMGYSAGAAEVEADRIAILLNSHSRMHDLISAELGSRYIVDDWVPREEGFVKAFPRGLVMHLLPGNVPLSSALSILRGLITKNICLAKIGSTDPLTAVALALSFTDVDPEHPVTKSMNVVYWEHDDHIGQRITQGADAVIAWGGADAMRYVRRHAADHAPVTCFGPKHSFALVDANADLDRAARALAHDVAIYDQQACFSIRRVFLTGPVEPFREKLHAELVRHAELLPPGELSIDRAAHIQLARRLDSFLGGQVTDPGTLDWTIVTAPPPEEFQEHPLGRVVYLHPVDSFDEAYRFADQTLQTIAAYPWSILVEHREEFARRGVSRFTELGLVQMFRIGGTHDGVNSLQGLVRMVATEASADVFGKGMVMRLDETAMLEAGTLKDFVL